MTLPPSGPPSRNTADDDTLTGMMRVVLAKFLQQVDDMLPAQVIAYDAAKNRARVQPLIDMVTTKNERIKRAQIASVPVAQFGAGGFVLRFPVKTGDLGWIKANDRDISLFKKNYVSSVPNTQRKHRFSDAVFIPETMMKGVTLAGEDANAAVLQSFDGSVRISLKAGVVKITAAAIELVGAVAVTGTLHANGVNVGSDHEHSGVQPGGGNSGPPI